MQYYKIGYNPYSFSEAHTMSLGNSHDAPNSAWKIPAIGEIKEAPQLNALVIEYNYKRANLVDAIPVNTHSGLIIDSKFLNTLLEFTVDEYQVFPATVRYRKKDYPYHFFHFVGDGNRFVDFEKSEFILSGVLNDAGEASVSLASYEIYLQLDQQVTQAAPPMRVKASKLVFLENSDVDFFRLYRLRYEYFVSERLKSALEAANIKGVKYEVVE